MYDMKTLLITGGTGFVGKNILPILSKKYKVFAPHRNELDLRDTCAVKNYVIHNKIDSIVHCANPNPVKSANFDSYQNMFEDSLKIFMNFYQIQANCEKIIYLGSGAEFDKSMNIQRIKEEDVHRSLPTDVYGASKYIMNELALHSKNIYNMRLFACYGPYDHESKFITHVIRCCLSNEMITIRQNCYFDYIHVFDLAKIIEYMIENDLKYHDYNVASGDQITLENIAKKVCQQMGYPTSKITFLKKELNKEYTADITRLENEMHLKNSFISLDDGISIQIQHERKWFNDQTSC